MIRNPLEPWDEATHPWEDLATVQITDPLSYEEQDQMAFEVTDLPPCMALFPAKSIHDYNSLNYMRKFAVWSIRARWLMCRLFGIPREYTDADAGKVRNKRPWGIRSWPAKSRVDSLARNGRNLHSFAKSEPLNGLCAF